MDSGRRLGLISRAARWPPSATVSPFAFRTSPWVCSRLGEQQPGVGGSISTQNIRRRGDASLFSGLFFRRGHGTCQRRRVLFRSSPGEYGPAAGAVVTASRKESRPPLMMMRNRSVSSRARVSFGFGFWGSSSLTPCLRDAVTTDGKALVHKNTVVSSRAGKRNVCALLVRSLYRQGKGLDTLVHSFRCNFFIARVV